VDISVIICAKNSEKTIEECLRSVERNNPSEIIVVDDGSTDGTVEVARRYTDKICLTQGKGQAYRRQLGAEKAEGDYIAYVDSDVVLSENCLQRLLEELKERGYIGIHAQVMNPENKTYWEWAEDQHFRMTFNKEGERSAIPTMAAIYSKSAIIEYKFDPFLVGASEDGDLCYRLRKDGYKFGIASVPVFHQHRSSLKSFVRQRIWYGKGNARIFWKHKSILALFGASLMIPFGIFVCVKRRGPKMLPYYFVWSISGNVGMVGQLAILVLKKLMLKVPQQGCGNSSDVRN
jgi:glycosyltransferase involved in cell wall biosynthesis